MREPRQRRRVRGLLVGLVAALLGLLGWAGWWWTHPALLDGTATLGNGVFAPKPVDGATAHMSVAMGPPSDETVELHSVEARFAVNTARARASFSICTQRPGAGLIGSVGDDEPLSRFCSKVRPVTDGTDFHFTPEGSDQPVEYILMTVTPTVPGRVRVDQVSFSYSRSWRHFHQHGTETSVQDWVVRATAG